MRDALRTSQPKQGAGDVAGAVGHDDPLIGGQQDYLMTTAVQGTQQQRLQAGDRQVRADDCRAAGGRDQRNPQGYRAYVDTTGVDVWAGGHRVPGRDRRGEPVA